MYVAMLIRLLALGNLVAADRAHELIPSKRSKASLQWCLTREAYDEVVRELKPVSQGTP